MKKTWFHHTDCSTEQADELVKRYKARGVRVERSLNPDYVTWTVSAFLRPQIHQRARIAAGETGCGGEREDISNHFALAAEQQPVLPAQPRAYTH
jgi:hypothetical protein